MAFKSILLLAVAIVSAKGDALFEPCFKDDAKCLAVATNDFLSKTYKGSAEFGLKTVDPLTISSLDVTADESMGLVFHFQNLKVTGLKDLKFHTFKMDTDKKSVRLQLKGDVTFDADFKVGLTKVNKLFTGRYTVSANVLETSIYQYDLKTGADGVEHFEVGPETNSCEVIGEPNVTLGGALANTLSSDEDAVKLKNEWESKKTAIRNKVVCEVVNRSMESLIFNLRKSATLFPKNAFFKDI